ncbi:acyl carrier protein [Streptomyces sp. NPDC057002]|uniref:acyl carrier protein n=1 Tax=Streptomyces sp. NPDC057002 TaxID=3345992 RepID=UPI0036330D4E
MTAHAHTVSESVVRHWLAERIGILLDRAGHEIQPDVLMAEYGLDSLQAVALAGEAEDRWGLPVDPDVAWEYPTVALLAAHLAARIADGD